ncbi:hypothetical protein [Cognaticolwellia beringensis]|uniref:hypothetical protein n=1 Tax=Cognaticolwellia beringensis TaxID=1967665 RepID=UPI0012FA5038|nr:hypothetical protein [Cognaticolwellia beringensis]
MGIFVWFDIPFNSIIVASKLAIIGYSFNDFFIVGDNIREIMKQNHQQSIESTVNLAVKFIIVRTMITSNTTLATIVAIWVFADESLSAYAMVLFSGVLVGTFSSITLLQQYQSYCDLLVITIRYKKKSCVSCHHYCLIGTG